MTWLITLTNTAVHSDVYSISYNWRESQLIGNTLAHSFNTELLKLCAMGVTVIAGSGSDGAAGQKYRSSTTSSCTYDPVFPASSPYVLAVGATMGLESISKEVACQSDAGCGVTSGGGFSNLFPAFSAQRDSISGYFKNETVHPVHGYNKTGRGYPDVAIAGNNLLAVIGGKEYLVSRAAVSSVAGMITLINAARRFSGRSTVGWLNPVLYGSGGSFANDVISGNNKCTVDTCCDQGFSAVRGWDPVTGFGSIDFGKLYSLLLEAPPQTAPPSSVSYIDEGEFRWTTVCRAFGAPMGLR